MNLKKNILLPMGIVVLLIVIGVPAVMLFNGIGKFSAANQKLNASIQELRELHGRNPFPSRENVKVERDNVEALKQWFDRLLTALQQGQITEASSTPTGFITEYGHTRNRLMSQVGARRGMIPSDFAFGFERYADGSLPAPGDVARLMQQLAVIEQLCTILIDAGVERIEDISREEFEATPAATASAPRPTSRRRPASSRRSRPAAPASPASRSATRSAALESETDLYSKQPFSLTVRANERTAVDIMNRLARHAMFVAATGLEFEKTGPDLRFPAAANAQSEAVSAAEAVADANGRDLPRQQRRVSGPEFELPMVVTIDVDVYTFTAGTGE